MYVHIILSLALIFLCSTINTNSDRIPLLLYCVNKNIILVLLTATDSLRLHCCSIDKYNRYVYVIHTMFRIIFPSSCLYPSRYNFYHLHTFYNSYIVLNISRMKIKSSPFQINNFWFVQNWNIFIILLLVYHSKI